jgi:hypothetical protein
MISEINVPCLSNQHVDSPHPGPLPWGEGESYPVLRVIGARSLAERLTSIHPLLCRNDAVHFFAKLRFCNCLHEQKATAMQLEFINKRCLHSSRQERRQSHIWDGFQVFCVKTNCIVTVWERAACPPIGRRGVRASHPLYVLECVRNSVTVVAADVRRRTFPTKTRDHSATSRWRLQFPYRFTCS